MYEKLLTIAIPTFNRVKNLKKLLGSIGEINYKKIEILVSDNSSNNDTKDFLEKHYPNVNYIKNSTNIGPDKNFLQCYNMAKGQYIWLVGDDDLIIRKGLDKLLDLIENNKSLALVFLNHNSYKTNNNGLYIGKDFLSYKDEFRVVDNKNDFAKISQYQLTFMSSFVINKADYNKVISPEKYIGTYFIHSYIAYEASKSNISKFGIVYVPCVSQGMDNDVERENEYKKNEFIFKTFTERQYNLFCNTAVLYGFNKSIMHAIHLNFLCKIFRFKCLLQVKTSNDANVKRLFWVYLFPYAKKSLKCWFLIIFPYVLLPNFILKFISYIYSKFSFFKLRRFNKF